MGPTGSRGLRVAQPRPPELLTVRDVAQRLRVSTATVYGLCECDALPHARVSNAIRIRAEDVEAYLRRQS
jgi:excisionase family DNA binding protein